MSKSTATVYHLDGSVSFLSSRGFLPRIPAETALKCLRADSQLPLDGPRLERMIARASAY